MKISKNSYIIQFFFILLLFNRNSNNNNKDRKVNKFMTISIKMKLLIYLFCCGCCYLGHGRKCHNCVYKSILFYFFLLEKNYNFCSSTLQIVKVIFFFSYVKTFHFIIIFCLIDSFITIYSILIY